MAIQTSPLAHNVAIVEKDGRPTPEFQRQWLSLSRSESGGGTGIYVRAGIMNGWASATGTASRATFVTYAAPAISSSYSQAQVQAIATHLQILSERFKAAIDDLKTLRAFNS